MPRQAREKSKSGIYHVILRGTNRQEIFHDEEDYLRFLETLERYKKKAEMEVYGWCLMSNHVHLLLKEGNEEISKTMKRIGVSFVSFYNLKYNTTGHLFQDRFKSECVDMDRYLLAVIRYIHQNPVSAGVVKNVTDWKWSSCHGYYGEKTYPTDLLNSWLVLSIISENEVLKLNKFKEFNEMENKDLCLEDNERRRLTDAEARAQINNVIPELKVTEVKGMPKYQRDEILLKIKGIEGLSSRQAARILGISPNLIFRA
ncbi:MAG: REP-associated tyrosine transposase [Bacillota bacterium]